VRPSGSSTTRPSQSSFCTRPQLRAEENRTPSQFGGILTKSTSAKHTVASPKGTTCSKKTHPSEELHQLTSTSLPTFQAVAPPRWIATTNTYCISLIRPWHALVCLISIVVLRGILNFIRLLVTAVIVVIVVSQNEVCSRPKETSTDRSQNSEFRLTQEPHARGRQGFMVTFFPTKTRLDRHCISHTAQRTSKQVFCKLHNTNRRSQKNEPLHY